MAKQTLRVYRGKNGTYYTTCSNTTETGEKYHTYMDVRFGKCDGPSESKADIIPETWFFSCRQYKDNRYPVLVITSWNPAEREGESVPQGPLPVEENTDFSGLDISSEDLPF